MFCEKDGLSKVVIPDFRTQRTQKFRKGRKRRQRKNKTKFTKHVYDNAIILFFFFGFPFASFA
jgi:hypothetical protein